MPRLVLAICLLALAPDTLPGDSDAINLQANQPINQPAISKPGRWRTEGAAEVRVFEHPGMHNLDELHPALSVQTEYYKTWNDGNDIFAFVPYARWDAEDSDRTHIDIRELTWVHVADNWELRTGIRKVFWGVTEAQHLVDIINQTDLVEHLDGEEKLGQPMLNLSLIRNWGILDMYWLTGFRERQFPGVNGRPRLPFLIDEAVFTSGAGKQRMDFALRWSQYFDALEIGLSHFSGTSREPRFTLRLIPNPAGLPVDARLIPIYDVIEQTGLEAQYLAGDWLWKLEAISRSGQGRSYTAATLGFEKTLVGLGGGRSDLGILAEYLYDDRGTAAPVIGEDDLALGFRYSLNNAADTTALLVWLYDSGEYLTTLEASSRLGADWKLVIEASRFSQGNNYGTGFPGLLAAFSDPKSELGVFQDETFVKLEVIRYFD